MVREVARGIRGIPHNVTSCCYPALKIAVCYLSSSSLCLIVANCLQSSSFVDTSFFFLFSDNFWRLTDKDHRSHSTRNLHILLDSTITSFPSFFLEGVYFVSTNFGRKEFKRHAKVCGLRIAKVQIRPWCAVLLRVRAVVRTPSKATSTTRRMFRTRGPG